MRGWRKIYSSMLESEDVAGLSAEALNLFVFLIIGQDDEGAYPWIPTKVKRLTLVRNWTPKETEGYLHELLGAGLADMDGEYVVLRKGAVLNGRWRDNREPLVYRDHQSEEGVVDVVDEAGAGKPDGKVGAIQREGLDGGEALARRVNGGGEATTQTWEGDDEVEVVNNDDVATPETRDCPVDAEAMVMDRDGIGPAPVRQRLFATTSVTRQRHVSDSAMTRLEEGGGGEERRGGGEGDRDRDSVTAVTGETAPSSPSPPAPAVPEKGGLSEACPVPDGDEPPPLKGEGQAKRRDTGGRQNGDPRVSLVLKDWEQAQGYPSGAYAAEAKAVKQMLGQHYQPHDILRCGTYLKEEDLYWRDRPVTMMTVAKQIGYWVSHDRKSEGPTEEELTAIIAEGVPEQSVLFIWQARQREKAHERWKRDTA